MKCSKCEKESTSLKNNLCDDCYKKNKKRRRKQKNKVSTFISSYIMTDETIITKAKTSNLAYIYITVLLAISLILFPRTILEFFFKDNKFFFLILTFNILLFFYAIFLLLYFNSREIYLTNKRILAKWGIFKVKNIKLPLNNINSIEAPNYIAIEISSQKNIYFFDLVSNSENFRVNTIKQIQNIITSVTDEKILEQFSHSDIYENLNSKTILCSCCGETISKESLYCVHCGQPIQENERTADLFIKIISFICPPIGLFLFLINIAAYPKFAKQCLASALIALLIILVIYLSILSIT